MIHNDLLQVRNVLQQHGILISFAGRLSQELIEEYGAAVKQYLDGEDIPQNNVFHTFSIFIEQTQNIKNYCLSKEGTELFEEISQSSIVTIGRNDDGHFVCSGNLVEKSDVDRLREKVQPLLDMDKDELKQHYKTVLRSEIPPGAGGAGLGLIDIARKASRPLEYSITDINNQVSFFALRAVV